MHLWDAEESILYWAGGCSNHNPQMLRTNTKRIFRHYQHPIIPKLKIFTKWWFFHFSYVNFQYLPMQSIARWLEIRQILDLLENSCFHINMYRNWLNWISSRVNLGTYIFFKKKVKREAKTKNRIFLNYKIELSEFCLYKKTLN